MPRKRIRRAKLAELFGVNVRTIDYWWQDKTREGKPKVRVLPPPHYLPGSPIPFWFEDEIPGATDTHHSEAT
jgi:hypothetical protein